MNRSDQWLLDEELDVDARSDIVVAMLKIHAAFREDVLPDPRKALRDACNAIIAVLENRHVMPGPQILGKELILLTFGYGIWFRWIPAGASEPGDTSGIMGLPRVDHPQLLYEYGDALEGPMAAWGARTLEGCKTLEFLARFSPDQPSVKAALPAAALEGLGVIRSRASDGRKKRSRIDREFALRLEQYRLSRDLSYEALAAELKMNPRTIRNIIKTGKIGLTTKAGIAVFMEANPALKASKP